MEILNTLSARKVRLYHELVNAGLYVTERDPNRNKAFKGRFMIAENLLSPENGTDDASTGGYCIVGDDLGKLIEDAAEDWQID